MLKAPARWGAFALLTTGMLLAPPPGVGGETAAGPPSPERSPYPEPQPPAEATYYAKLAEYRLARAAYEKQADAYWDRITATRTARRKRRTQGREIGLSDYVLEQPPVYRGPPEPVAPPTIVRPPRPPAQPTPIPVIADFLEQARAHFGFVPDAPTDADFKRAYAAAAQQAGIEKSQAVRIFGFEAGGNGRYDVQAGLEAPGSKRRAISTALGYNQLLTTNTISLLAEHGERFVDALREQTAGQGAQRRAHLEGKIAILKQMIRFARSVPKKWSEQEDLAKTPKGWALHALNLDIDVGPLLQAQKLADSIDFARRKGYTARLTAAELEMLNLMGDGSGYDVISMPEHMRSKVPTANMFQRGGYERNSVVRKFNTVSALLSATDAKMDNQTDLPGAREMEAAFDALGASAASVPVR